MSDDPDRAFDLDSEPFPGEGPDGFFFPTAELSQRVDLVHHLVQFSDLTLVVSGPKGIGKTTFLEELLRTAGDRWRICRVDASPGIDPDGLVAALLDGFDLPPRSEHAADSLEVLESHLEALHRSQQVALVAIDDAHLLAPATRDAAMDLVSRWEGFKARVLLLEEPSDAPFRDGSGRDLDELIHRVELPYLAEEQTGDYIHVRLTRAGLVGDSPFTDEVVRGVHRASDGILGRIDALATQVLENQRHTAPRTRRRPSVAVAALALIALGAAALAIYEYRDRGEPDSPGGGPRPPSADFAPAEDAAAKLAAGPPAVGSGPASLDEISDPAPDPLTGASTEATPSAAVEVVPEPAPEIDGSTIPPDPAPDATEIAESNERVPDAGGEPTESGAPAAALTAVDEAIVATEIESRRGAEPESTVRTGQGDGSGAVVVAVTGDTEPVSAPVALEPPTPAAEPATEAVPVPANEAPAPAPVIEAAPQPDAGAAPQSDGEAAPDPAPEPRSEPSLEPSQPTEGAPAAPAPTQKSAPAPEPPRAADPRIPGLRDLAWLRTQPRDAFTIQLIGSHDSRSIEQFAARHGLGDESIWARTRYEGRDWFVVLSGIYPDIDRARAAIRTLSYGLRRGSPWPRSVASVLGSAATP